MFLHQRINPKHSLFIRNSLPKQTEKHNLPKARKTIFKLSETHINKNTPKKTHTRTKNTNKTTLEKNNQQGVYIHGCLILHSNQQTPDCIALLFPGPLLFSVLSHRLFLFQKQIPPALRSQLHTQNKKKFQTLST